MLILPAEVGSNDFPFHGETSMFSVLLVSSETQVPDFSSSSCVDCFEHVWSQRCAVKSTQPTSCWFRLWHCGNLCHICCWFKVLCFFLNLSKVLLYFSFNRVRDDNSVDNYQQVLLNMSSYSHVEHLPTTVSSDVGLTACKRAGPHRRFATDDTQTDNPTRRACFHLR